MLIYSFTNTLTHTKVILSNLRNVQAANKWRRYPYSHPYSPSQANHCHYNQTHKGVHYWPLRKWIRHPRKTNYILQIVSIVGFYRPALEISTSILQYGAIKSANATDICFRHLAPTTSKLYIVSKEGKIYYSYKHYHHEL